MSGRRAQPSQGRSHGQARRLFAGGRGHGAHHRRGSGEPRPLATGRSRAAELVRDRSWRRGEDEELADLPGRQRLSTSQERLEPEQPGAPRGAHLPGAQVTGQVLEVCRGAFLMQVAVKPALPPGARPLPEVLRVVPRGTLEHYDLGLASLVAAGDRVEAVVLPIYGNEEYEGALTRVLPRTSEFRRLHASGRAVQTLAANVDQVAAVGSVAEPDFRPGFVDRALVCAAANSLPALLILNKIDLKPQPELDGLLTAYRRLGLPVLETSVRTGAGLDALRAALAGHQTMLCGHSGVGKTSLLTILAPQYADEVHIEAVSARTTKGQHATTHARWYALPDGAVVDTPGLRELTPVDTDQRNLWGWFPELAGLQGQCAFADCTHRSERGCAVRAAVEAGEIHPRRYESYVRIYETLPQ